MANEDDPYLATTAATMESFDHPSRLSVEQLAHLLVTGEGADYTIATPTQAFSVHKCVVYRMSAFFAAKCDGSYGPEGKAFVNVYETPETVQDMIKFMYSQPIPTLSLDHSSDLSDSSAVWKKFQAVMNLARAANKYSMNHSLYLDCTTITKKLLETTKSPYQLVRMGVELFKQPDVAGHSMSVYAQQQTCRHITGVLMDNKAWSALYNCEEYARTVMQMLDEQAKYGRLTSFEGQV